MTYVGYNLGSLYVYEFLKISKSLKVTFEPNEINLYTNSIHFNFLLKNLNKNIFILYSNHLLLLNYFVLFWRVLSWHRLGSDRWNSVNEKIHLLTSGKINYCEEQSFRNVFNRLYNEGGREFQVYFFSYVCSIYLFYVGYILIELFVNILLLHKDILFNT